MAFFNKVWYNDGMTNPTPIEGLKGCASACRGCGCFLIILVVVAVFFLMLIGRGGLT